MNLEKKFETQVINDVILNNLSLKNRYLFLNKNLKSILKEEEISFLKEIEQFCLDYQKKIDHSEDLYKWYPDFGAKGYICRVHSFAETGVPQEPFGLMIDLTRHFGIEFFDPQFNWSIDASVLCINPLHAHHENIDIRINALKELISGKAVGCVCITEPERGSDATHQLTTCKKINDGFIINGTKAFNTNAPKANYAIVYATEEQNNPDKMVQCLVKFPSEGLKIERIYIPFVPRVYLGKEIFKDVFVPKEQILADVGKGKIHMFEGLVLERLGIAMLNISESWNAFSYIAIYSNLREQMGKTIIDHQGVGFILVDLWTKLCNLTRAISDVCRSFDEVFKKYKGNIPKDLNKSFITSASQLKYDCAKFNVNMVYECMNLMGGAGVCDNTLMNDIMGVSRVQEIVGGTRQIQQYILQGTLKTLLKSDIE